MKKFVAIQTIGSCISVTAALLLAAALSKTTFAYTELSIVFASILVAVFTSIHIYGHGTATLDVKKRSIEMSEELYNRDNIVLTTVIPDESNDME